MPQTLNAITSQLRQQARHCKGHGAPKTASVVAALASALRDPSTLCTSKLRHWSSSLLEDAVGLRLAAGLHYLHLTSREPRLQEIYEGRITRQEEIDRVVANVIFDHDKELLTWFDTTPQTNEVGRSGSILLGLVWAHAHTLPNNLNFEVLEIGSSGGLNLLMPHYRYTFLAENGKKSWTWGDENSMVHIQPKLRGPLPPCPEPFRIISAKGCDLHPVNLKNNDEALRLRAFVWIDMEWRVRNLEEAIKIANNHPPLVAKEDAGVWVKAMLNPNLKNQEVVVCSCIVLYGNILTRIREVSYLKLWQTRQRKLLQTDLWHGSV